MSWRNKPQPAALSLRWQLALSYAALALVITALLTGLAFRTASSMSLAAERRHALAAINGVATAFGEALAQPTADVARVARQQSLASGGRVLWLNADNTVRVDGFEQAALGGSQLTVPNDLTMNTTAEANVYVTESNWLMCASSPVFVSSQNAGSVLLLLDLNGSKQDLYQLRSCCGCWAD